MNVKADKSLGQHFLKNKEMIEQICNQSLADFDFILEVGPGPATLTKNLAKRDFPLHLVEKDERFKEILENVKPSPQILFQDALKFNLNDYQPSKDKKVWIVSNLPYNISATLLTNFLEWKNVTCMTLMFQREVGEKTLLGEKNSSLSCLVNNYFETKLLLKLKPGAFHPPPEVHSVVINYIRKENPAIKQSEFKSYESFLRKVFAQRRKQMVGVLKGNYSKESLLEFLKKEEIPSTIRAEDLDLDQIIALYKWLTHE